MMGVSGLKLRIVGLTALVLSVFNSSVFSQSVNQQIFSSSGTFTVPDCISEITVEVWGAGGGGGTNGDDDRGGGGGGGGAYSRSTFTVTSGTSYSVTIGAGGAANTAGQQSIFATTTGSVIVSANGGSPGTGSTGATIGTGGAGGTTGGVGQVKFAGGNGGNSGNNGVSMGGGGGSSAGHSQNGRNGSTPETYDYSWGYPGGAAPVGGARGGIGGTNTGGCNAEYRGPATAGAAGGGGGGGGSENNAPATRAGASGGNGKVVVFYGPVRTVSTVGVNAETWTCPAGITKLLVQAWGAGGGGGGNDQPDGGGGGGGGGAFSETEIDVSSGQTYSITVGGGGSGGANSGQNGGAGGSSSLQMGGTVYVLAAGGSGGINRNSTRLGGQGGQSSVGTGNFRYSGGNGGTGSAENYGHGGGGGASAGYNANGGNGANVNDALDGCDKRGGAGGVAPSGGVDGASAYSHYNYTFDANSHGAGGAGGSEENGGATGRGGAGGDGMVFLDWNPVWSLSSNGGSGVAPIAAGYICSQGQDVPIHSVGIKGHNLNPCVSSADLTGFRFTTTGTYQTTDINNFKLYYSTASTFAVSTSTLVSTIASPAVAGTQIFPAFNVTLDDTQFYFWVTTNVTSGAVDGRTITVGQTTYSDITLSRNVSRGSLAAASGTQTIRKNSLSSTLSPSAICTGTTFTYVPTSAQPSPTFSWSRAAVAGIVQASASGTYSVSEVLTNTTTSAINVIYTYTTTSSGCSNSGENVVVTVNPNANIALTSAVGTNNQYICRNAAITNIVYAGNSSVTSLSVAGLPAGVTSTPASNTLTMSGTPTVSGVYVYTVTSTGICTQTSTTGTLTVGLSIVSGYNANAQQVCKNSAISEIRYAVGASATTINWSPGIPSGINTNFSGGVFSITGTPDTDGTYTYTLSTSGCTPEASLTGTITVGIGQPISSGALSQIVCNSTSLTGININFAGTSPNIVWSGPNGAVAPTGVSSGTVTASTYMIGGIPTSNGTYTYTVSTNGCTP